MTRSQYPGDAPLIIFVCLFSVACAIFAIRAYRLKRSGLDYYEQSRAMLITSLVSLGLICAIFVNNIGR